MPDLMDDDLLDENTDENGEQDDSAGGEKKPPASPPASDDKSEKRIRDLQSKADAAEAKANRLQRLLNEALKGEGSEGGTEPPVVSKPRELDAGSAMALELLKETVFLQTPALADSGLTAADLTGYTAQEVRASAASLARKIAETETRIRNKVLAEHGLAPEIAGEGNKPEPDRDFGKMASKDFTELMERIMKG
jgi:hypothetical protein